ncbi:MAG: PASTA domain-containing protein [Candidatus Hydrogenedentes bacterium]|nr:PASTA domain-containing protein [Candidatus Hydrogenedentota bacterium]
MARYKRTVSDPAARRGPGRFLLDAFSETVLNVVFFVIGFIGWCIRWTAATVIFLIVMAVAGYFVFMEALAGGDYVTVPNIVDLPITEASAMLAEVGLEMGKQVQVAHDVVPKYHIISQRPDAGKVVRTGRKVIPTVSLGADAELAPDVLRKTREEAEREIKKARFRVGAVARIPDNSPRDTVLAQDPPPGANVPRQSGINLLLSAGSDREGTYMPDIQDKPVLEIRNMLAPFGVYLIPNEVDIQNAREDIVLNQSPAPNTLIRPGDVVTYDVKPSRRITLPNDEHQAEVRHQMLYDYYGSEVKVDVVDLSGNRETKATYPPAFDEQSKQTRVAGSTIRVLVQYIGEATVEIYVNGELEESYALKDGGSPVPSHSTAGR